MTANGKHLYEQKKYKKSTYNVLTSILFMAHDNIANIEIPQLIQQTALSKNTLMSALSVLQDDGFITIKHSKGNKPTFIESNIRIVQDGQDVHEIKETPHKIKETPPSDLPFADAPTGVKNAPVAKPKKRTRKKPAPPLDIGSSSRTISFGMDERINADMLGDFFNNILDKYNSRIHRIQWMTPKRIALLRLRINEIIDRLGADKVRTTIADVITTAAQDGFCNGENDHGWTADFDYIFSIKGFTRLLEGGFRLSRQAEAQKARQEIVDSTNDFINRHGQPTDILLKQPKKLTDPVTGEEFVPYPDDL